MKLPIVLCIAGQIFQRSWRIGAILGGVTHNTSRQDTVFKRLNLTQEAAHELCKTHGHRKAAQETVDSLPNRISLKPADVKKRVKKQILYFEENLVKCVELANDVTNRAEQLPKRAEQGSALRKIRKALDNLRDAVEGNWDLAKLLLEFDAAENLGRLMTTEATLELLNSDHRSEYIKAADNIKKKVRPTRGAVTRRDVESLHASAGYQHEQLKRSFFFNAGSGPLIQLIKGATIVVRRAEKKIAAGAPLKAPLEMALILQLADHFEWVLQKTASWTDNGPFSKFAADVFAELEIEPYYSWEHLLREGLKQHRSSFVTRRRHAQPSVTTRKDQTVPGHSRRKTLLVSKSRKHK